MNKMRIFLPLTKVDAVQRLVFGQITAEVVDKSKEILDYATSKPLFEKWSADTLAKTQAAGTAESLGNVRAMHGAVAAGKLTAIDFNDSARTIDACAKIVDDAEWNKVIEGVYTGFSIGGSYALKWADPTHKGVTRFTADPAEVSLVDNPCVPTAHFSMVKADGVTSEVAFKLWAPTNDEIAAEAGTMAKAAGEKRPLVELMDEARESLLKRHGLPDDEATTEDNPQAQTIEEPSPVEKAAGEGGDPAPVVEPEPVDFGIDQVFKVRADASVFATKAEAKKHADSLRAITALGTDNPLTAALDKAMASARKAAETVAVTGDGNDLATMGKALAVVVEIAIANAPMDKGLYAVREMARVVQDLSWLTSEASWEAKAEGDGSQVPASMLELTRAAGAALLAMTTEELAELLAGLTSDGVLVDVEVLEASVGKAIDLVKANTALMAKAGKRNSTADQSKIQAMHDHAKTLGAACDGDAAAKAAVVDPADPLAKVADVAVVIAERDQLQKWVTEAMPKVEALAKMVEDQAGEIAKLKAEPAPMPTLTVLTRNGQQAGGEVAKTAEDAFMEAAAQLTPDQMQKLSFKVALAKPTLQVGPGS